MKKKYLTTGLILFAAPVIIIFLLKMVLQPASFKEIKDDGSKALGHLAAPVHITEYSDFECPACRYAAPVLKDLLARYPNQLYLVFRHFPLEGHKHSPLAHQAAECAAQAGKFWPYHDRLYQVQSDWTALSDPSVKFIEYARDLAIDIDQFAACLTDERIRQVIAADKKSGAPYHVNSTPTFFIAGRRFVGARQLQVEGEAFIREKLGLPPSEKQSAPS